MFRGFQSATGNWLSRSAAFDSVAKEHMQPKRVVARVPVVQASLECGRVSISQLKDESTPGGRSRMIPLTEHHEEDEEEDRLRAMKAFEAKQQRAMEAAALQQKKKDLEMADAAKANQQAKQPYTHDSAGGIILVEAVNTDKLPSAMQTVKYNLRETPSTPSKADVSEQSKKAVSNKVANKTRKRAPPEFTDGFCKNEMQQPNMVEAMKMSPGVQLSEKGSSKTGHDGINQEKKQMSRKDYLSLVQQGPVRSDPVSASSCLQQIDAPAVSSRSRDPGVQPSRCQENDAFNQAIASAEDWGTTLQPINNCKERHVVQPVAPSIAHNSKLRYDAVGSRPTPRDRNLPHRQNHLIAQRGQFPPSLQDVDAVARNVPRVSQKHGEIHTQNRQLLQRLFDL